MARFLDKYKNIKCYLIYYYKGEIKVKSGFVKYRGYDPYKNVCFYPENTNTWHTGVPFGFGFVNSKGKILVEHKENIPKAKELLRDYYASKKDEIRNRAESSLRNIEHMIQQQREELIERTTT